MSPVKVFITPSSPEIQFDQDFQISIPKLKQLKWSEARKIALRRDGRCRICSSDSPLTVHHMWPRGLGGGHEIENLVTLCESCHQHICASCSRDELARVPGWVKPDLRRCRVSHTATVRYGSGPGTDCGSLSEIFSDTATSMSVSFPRKLAFFWELAGPELRIFGSNETE